MNKIKYTLILIIIILTFSECSQPSENPQSSVDGEWLIPQNEVFDGGPGQDRIPALTNPVIEPVQNITYLKDDDLVIGVKNDNNIRAYPHVILDWHEIINDNVGNLSVAVTYCPLTGSAIGWNRILNGSETIFGVSGLLYNSNLIPYDRATGSRWSQMLMKSVNGSLIGKNIKTETVVETTWKTWKEMYPESKVVSKNTGYSRSYGFYPYGDYKTNNNNLLFPVSHKDNRLPAKERVFGILINGDAFAFTFDFFNTINLTNTTLSNVPVVIYGNKEKNLAIAYESTVGNKVLNFNLTDKNLPAVFKDDLGNVWNIFGEAIEGPDKGTKLKPVTAFISYWFAWAAFYPDTELKK